MRISDWSSDVCSSDLAPAVILVRPQLGENIGMVARAMLNCGLTELRLVRPRDGWPSAKAEAAASGALSVLEADRKSTRLNSQSLMRISSAVFCLQKKIQNL